MKKDLLRSLREAKFTLKELAARIGMSESQLSKIETGKREARVEELVAMARELGVSPSVFFDDSNGSGSAFTAGNNSETIQQFGSVSGVPVMGEAVAKRWVEDDEAGASAVQFADVPAVPGRFDPRSQFAFKINGSAMSARDIHHDEYVICVPYWEAREQVRNGDLVVIERRREGLVEVSCREAIVAGQRIEFYSRSADNHDGPVTADRELNESGNFPIKIIGLVVGKYKPIGV